MREIEGVQKRTDASSIRKLIRIPEDKVANIKFKIMRFWDMHFFYEGVLEESRKFLGR